MYSFVFNNNNNKNPSIKLSSHDFSFRNETITNYHLDIPYYDDENTQAENMNINNNSSSLTPTLDEIIAASSANISMQTETFFDKKLLQDYENFSLAITKVVNNLLSF